MLPQGFMLVIGATGSGKSTTLASMIGHINRNRPVHIITIEDPIEYLHEHDVAAVDQREIGEDTESFPLALRAVLREDPDVVLVGEMRDLESIQNALTIAETGHLVFATLHANDTAQAVDRVVDVFPGRRTAADPSAAGQHSRRHPVPDARAKDRWRPRAGVRDSRRHARHQEPDPRGQEPTDPQRRCHEPARRHADAGVVAQPLVAEGLIEREEAIARSMNPKEIAEPELAQAPQPVQTKRGFRR